MIENRPRNPCTSYSLRLKNLCWLDHLIEIDENVSMHLETLLWISFYIYNLHTFFYWTRYICLFKKTLYLILSKKYLEFDWLWKYSIPWARKSFKFSQARIFSTVLNLSVTITVFFWISNFSFSTIVTEDWNRWF